MLVEIKNRITLKVIFSCELGIEFETLSGFSFRNSLNNPTFLTPKSVIESANRRGIGFGNKWNKGFFSFFT